MNALPALVTALAAGAALCPRAAAQTLFALDGANATVREVAGPPDPTFCSYPLGPVQSLFQTPGAFACLLPGAVAPGPELKGDVAVDRVRDEVWVTDGVRIAAYDSKGVAVQSFGVPAPLLGGPVLGLGFDGGQGTLWLTDGIRALELFAPTAPCGTPSVATPPFPLPPLSPVSAAVTDIDWDPATGTLWVCDANGFVGNVTRSGVLLSAFLATPGGCGLAKPLLGLAVDTASSTAGKLYVSDGSTVATFDPTGLGTVTFGQPFACFPLPGGKANGLGFSSRPIRYGAGGGVVSPPEIGSVGEAVIPSTNLAVTLSGATAGAVVILPFSLAPLCPEIVVSTVPVLIFPQSFALFVQTVGPSGTAQVGIPIPPTATPGLEVFYQWFVAGGGPSPDGPPLLSSGAGSMRTGFH